MMLDSAESKDIYVSLLEYTIREMTDDDLFYLIEMISDFIDTIRNQERDYDGQIKQS